MRIMRARTTGLMREDQIDTTHTRKDLAAFKGLGGLVLLGRLVVLLGMSMDRAGSSLKDLSMAGSKVDLTKPAVDLNSSSVAVAEEGRRILNCVLLIKSDELYKTSRSRRMGHGSAPK